MFVDRGETLRKRAREREREMRERDRDRGGDITRGREGDEIETRETGVERQTREKLRN